MKRNFFTRIGFQMVGRLTHAILDHDHCAVDDHTEIDRTETHQIRRNPCIPHRDQRAHGRERNRCGDDQSGSQIPEQNDEHHNHQEDSESDVLSDGVDRFFDQIRAIVKSVDLDSLGESLLNRMDLLFDLFDHLARVSPHDHHDHSDDRFAISVPSHRTLS